VFALALSVAVVLFVSAFCSISEAAVYAVRRPFVRKLAAEGSRAGRVLEGFKRDMGRPIAAILVVNTAANTAGASVAGAQASALFGEGAFLWFSMALTLGVLFLSEIVPKVLGVSYSRTVARAVAIPWQGLIGALLPLTYIAEVITRKLQPSEPALAAPEDEVSQFATMAAEEGSILPIEAKLVQNVLKLDEIAARDIMTPRTVVFRLSEDMTVRQVAAHVDDWQFSRIPIYDPDDPERWTGLVRAADVLVALAQDRFDTKLAELARPLHFVPDGAPGHQLLKRFLAERTHLFGVVDEFGGMAGVATLEDVVESLLGQEIVDEVDRAEDLRAVARGRRRSFDGRDRPE
jgi:CBS domain containing-hemolysin-like protein